LSQWQQHCTKRDHPIRVIRPVVRRADVENIENEMQELLALARIEAEQFIVPTGLSAWQ
jgi:hypothetical protein